jgi:squalene-hopene/tetraprenyl-beta-curcumene cyclase
MRKLLIPAAAVAAVLAAWPADRAAARRRAGPDPAVWQQTVDKAVAALKKSQDPVGSWSGDRSPGVTGIVLTGLLKCGRVTPDDEVAARALAYIESLVNEKAGHIAGPDPRPQLLNYVTSVNVMALQAANRGDKYKAVIGNAAAYLKRLQFDEEEGKGPGDPFYGGIGYDSKSRPDLSNVQIALDALQAAGVPKDDPAIQRALVFVSRCQNLKTEHNDQPWAGKINDGSFIYTAAGGGETKVDAPAGELPGYGSMTYAGVKSMIYCGVSKDDPRMKGALNWLRRNYTVDGNPGMPPAQRQRGLYYYYHTMAKCLAALGEDEFTDATGVKHDWRADVTAALAKRQRPDGTWVNENDRWMEGDPNLVTGYALMALAYCKPR